MPVLLGHNQLSIIDLSAAANQPMEIGDFTIVYDGEVYNYFEIRDELTKKGYRFRTNSDTEVVLAAYTEWGSACVTRFMGMWAFAIWDKRRRELFCSRDGSASSLSTIFMQATGFISAQSTRPLRVSPLSTTHLTTVNLAAACFFQSCRTGMRRTRMPESPAAADQPVLQRRRGLSVGVLGHRSVQTLSREF